MFAGDTNVVGTQKNNIVKNGLKSAGNALNIPKEVKRVYENQMELFKNMQ